MPTTFRGLCQVLWVQVKRQSKLFSEAKTTAGVGGDVDGTG